MLLSSDYAARRIRVETNQRETVSTMNRKWGESGCARRVYARFQQQLLMARQSLR